MAEAQPRDSLAVRAEPVAGLSEAAIADMFALYRRYYDGTGEALFRADLAGKRYVIVLRDGAGTLRGFSTVAVTDHQFEGAPLRAVFSGDTVVDHRFWGQQALAHGWIRLAGGLKAATPMVPLYWFLIVKGHRTYRFLRLFCRSFHPACDAETPARTAALMAMLARDRFGDAYDEAAGIVRFPTTHGHLRPDWAAVPAKDRDRADVRYFLARNPGYGRGDELVCLGELSLDNLRPPVARLFAAGMAEPPP